jgi:SAM-dependent methyltransferase
MSPAGDFDYERGGTGYALRRRPDPSIAALVRRALGESRTVVNVGAGAGSYEPEDLDVTAVEPSAMMRSQRRSDRPAIDAIAEDLPFEDATFDAALASVTVHQWSNRDQGLREMRRVSRGPVVLLTFDPDALDRFWLAHYAPELIEAERARYPTLEHIAQVLGGDTEVIEVRIPRACTDGFTEAFYARPEAFLDDDVRRSQSAWSFVTAEVATASVEALRHDLASGEWDRRFGELRGWPSFVGSLRLLVNYPADDRPGKTESPFPST